MKVYITVKSIGKRKNHLDRKEWQLTEAPETLKAFLTDLVTINVKEFNERQTDVPFVFYLTKSEVELQAASGKVGFGTIYNERKADAEEATHAALLAFEDGLYKMFINDNEVESLEESLALQEGDDIALIRFTLLAGRLW